MTRKKPAPPITASVEARRRAVEDLYLNGYRTKEIFQLLGPVHDVCYGTIRNDIVAVRAQWTEDGEGLDKTRGRERYLAALHQIRRETMGRDKPGAIGQQEQTRRDFKMAHEIDKELARINGVKLRSDQKDIHLSIESAREYMDRVMEAIFTVVTDEKQREAVIAALEAVGPESG